MFFLCRFNLPSPCHQGKHEGGNFALSYLVPFDAEGSFVSRSSSGHPNLVVSTLLARQLQVTSFTSAD